MSVDKKPAIKARLHVRNKNREQYDLKALTSVLPELAKHVQPNKFGVDSVNFSDPKAVKLLNKALLNHYYSIKNWDFPDENLCPPIPGRADYIHHIADLLCEHNFGKIPTGNKVVGLDVGTGASCIYPIIGTVEYGWQFVATDIDPKSIASAQQIIKSNEVLKGKVICKLQPNATHIFDAILSKKDKVDFTMCNPPFHASLEEAQKGTRRKVRNLSGKNQKAPVLNFAGNSNELICEGGEVEFIRKMIAESEKFAKNCFLFSTLVSKQSNLKGFYGVLEKTAVTKVKTIPMGTGNKSTRILTWTFLTKNEQKEWKTERW